MKKLFLLLLLFFMSTDSFSETISPSYIFKNNPFELWNDTLHVEGIFHAKKYMSKMTACINQCCNVSKPDVFALSDSIDLELVLNTNSFLNMFSQLCIVSECHPTNLAVENNIFLCQGTLMKITLGPSVFDGEKILLNVFKIFPKDKKLIYSKDSLFISNQDGITPDNVLTIMNPTSDPITLDSIFTDSLELSDKNQGLVFKVCDTNNKASDYMYIISNTGKGSHKYVFASNQTNQPPITIPSNSWITLRTFKYDSDPLLLTTDPRFEYMRWNHDKFCYKLTFIDSENESAAVNVYFDDIHALAVRQPLQSSQNKLKSNNINTVNLNGREITSGKNTARSIVINKRAVSVKFDSKKTSKF